MRSLIRLTYGLLALKRIVGRILLKRLCKGRSIFIVYWACIALAFYIEKSGIFGFRPCCPPRIPGSFLIFCSILAPVEMGQDSAPKLVSQTPQMEGQTSNQSILLPSESRAKLNVLRSSRRWQGYIRPAALQRTCRSACDWTFREWDRMQHYREAQVEVTFA